jgi:hypothetical protein
VVTVALSFVKTAVRVEPSAQLKVTGSPGCGGQVGAGVAQAESAAIRGRVARAFIGHTLAVWRGARDHEAASGRCAAVRL